MIREVGGRKPRIAKSSFVSEAAYVVGDVEIGENSSVWPGVVIRADFSSVKIGRNTHIEDNAMIHASFTPVTIGDNVIIGHCAMVHAGKVGDNVLIGMNATVMHDVEIGDHCVIAGGAVIPEGMNIPGGSFVAGVPAQIKGKVTQKQSIWINETSVSFYSELAKEYKKGKL